MTNKEFIPQPPHFPADLAKRLDEQDLQIRELTELAKETTALLAKLTKLQEEHSSLLGQLSSALASRQPRD